MWTDEELREIRERELEEQLERERNRHEASYGAQRSEVFRLRGVCIQYAKENQALKDAIRGLFKHCVMFCKDWGDGSTNAAEATTAIETARKLIQEDEE